MSTNHEYTKGTCGRVSINTLDWAIKWWLRCWSGFNLVLPNMKQDIDWLAIKVDPLNMTQINQPQYWTQVSMHAVDTHYLEWSLNIFSGTMYSYRLRTVWERGRVRETFLQAVRTRKRCKKESHVTEWYHSLLLHFNLAVQQIGKFKHF